MTAGWLTLAIVVVFVGGPLVAAFTGGAHRAGVVAGDGGRVDSAATEDASAATEFRLMDADEIAAQRAFWSFWGDGDRIPPVRETSVDDVLLNDAIARFNRGEQP